MISPTQGKKGPEPSRIECPEELIKAYSTPAYDTAVYDFVYKAMSDAIQAKRSISKFEFIPKENATEEERTKILEIVQKANKMLPDIRDNLVLQSKKKQEQSRIVIGKIASKNGSKRAEDTTATAALQRFIEASVGAGLLPAIDGIYEGMKMAVPMGASAYNPGDKLINCTIPQVYYGSSPPPSPLSLSGNDKRNAAVLLHEIIHNMHDKSNAKAYLGRKDKRMAKVDERIDPQMQKALDMRAADLEETLTIWGEGLDDPKNIVPNPSLYNETVINIKMGLPIRTYYSSDIAASTLNEKGRGVRSKSIEWRIEWCKRFIGGIPTNDAFKTADDKLRAIQTVGKEMEGLEKELKEINELKSGPRLSTGQSSAMPEAPPMDSTTVTAAPISASTARMDAPPQEQERLNIAARIQKIRDFIREIPNDESLKRDGTGRHLDDRQVKDRQAAARRAAEEVIEELEQKLKEIGEPGMKTVSGMSGRKGWIPSSTAKESKEEKPKEDSGHPQPHL